MKTKSNWMAALAVGVVTALATPTTIQIQESQRLIVRAGDSNAARQLVERVGGTVTRELTVIDSVAATVTPGQRSRLATDRAVRQLFEDRSVAVDARKSKNKASGGRIR